MQILFCFKDRFDRKHKIILFDFFLGHLLISFCQCIFHFSLYPNLISQSLSDCFGSFFISIWITFYLLCLLSFKDKFIPSKVTRGNELARKEFSRSYRLVCFYEVKIHQFNLIFHRSFKRISKYLKNNFNNTTFLNLTGIYG